MLTNSSKYNLNLYVFVYVSATVAAFIEMTVHQVSLWRTVSNHRCVEVGRTPHLGSSTCLVLSWCVSLPWSISPSCCFFFDHLGAVPVYDLVQRDGVICDCRA